MTERMKTYQADRQAIIARLDERVKICSAKFDVTKGVEQLCYWVQEIAAKVHTLKTLEELHNAFLLAEDQE